jgi:hypothetical protein
MFDAADVAVINTQRGALRVQIAAVAAQQAALLEEESRLRQQHAALAQQQNQLASHLDAKRQRAQELAGQVHAARTALIMERREHERAASKQVEELAIRQADVERQQKQLKAERHRAVLLRRRLKRRFQRRLAAARTQTGRMDAGATHPPRNKETEAEQLIHERDALVTAQLKFKGDCDAAGHQLRTAWEEFRIEQSRLRQEYESKGADLAIRAQVLRKREESLEQAETAFQRQKHDEELKRKAAEHEVLGLENRIVNLRQTVSEMQVQRDNPKATASAALSLGHCLETNNHPLFTTHLPSSTVHNLQRLAHDLGDQRLEIVEHWRRLLLAHQEWEKDRKAAADILETHTLELRRKDHDLLAREADLNRRFQEITQFRQYLEGWAARVRLRESTAAGQNCRKLADLERREETVEKQLRALMDVRKRWAERRRLELDQLHAERAACETLQVECNRLRQECWKRAMALERQEREVLEKSLALEQYQQRLVLRSQDAAATDHRLLRLRKKWQMRNNSLIAATAAEFERLRDEAANLHQRGQELLKVAIELSRREAELNQQQNALDEKLTTSQMEKTRLETLLQSAQDQRGSAERQAIALQAQVEDLAKILLDGVDLPAFKST